MEPKEFKFILKRIVLSNNRDEHIIKLPTSKKHLLEKMIVSKDEPWILQQFIHGTDVAACVYCRDGDVKIYSDSICCECCVNYYPVQNQAIKEWLTRKCKQFKLDGLICLDFMEAEDGRCFVLECNPRPHSCTLLMKDPEWITSLMDESIHGTYDANSNEKEHVFWLYHELLRMIGVLDMFPEAHSEQAIMNGLYRKDNHVVFVDEFGYLNFNIKGVLVGRDAVLNVYDPWPVVVSHGLHMPLLLIKQILGGCGGWSVFDLCIVKLVCNDL